MEECVKKSYFVQNFGIFLIVFSYFNVFNNVFAIGLIIATGGLLYRHFKCHGPFLDLHKVDVPWVAIGLMLLFGITAYAVAFFALDVSVSKKVAINYLNYMRPFFLLLIFANKKDSFAQAIWAGIVVGPIGICVGGDNALKQFFILHQRRPDGIFDNPNALAGHLLLLIPIILAGLFDKGFNKILKILAMVSLIIVLLTLIITESRGAIIALVLAGIGAIFYYTKNQKRAFMIMFISAILGVSLISFLAPKNIDRFSRIFQYQKLEAYGDRERIYLWESATMMFKDHPVAGVGLGNFNSAYNSGYMMPDAKNNLLVHPHNMILYSMSETGIVGTIGLLSLIAWQLVISFKNRYKNTHNLYGDMFFFTIITMLIHGMVDCMFHVGSFARIYWILWAFTCLSIVFNNKLSDKK